MDDDTSIAEHSADVLRPVETNIREVLRSSIECNASYCNK